MPIVRGLLAEPTGNQDIPYEPVILKSMTSKEAVDFAGSAKNAEQVGWGLPHRKKIGGLKPTLRTLLESQKPPLFLYAPVKSADPEKIRKRLSDSISDYSQQYNCKPEIICLRDVGILYVDRADNNSDLPLKNKVAVVTGAAGAIGYGVCRGLLEAGCHLAATDLAGKKLDDFAADLKEIGGERVIGVPIDVTDKGAVAREQSALFELIGSKSVLAAYYSSSVAYLAFSILLVLFVFDGFVQLEGLGRLHIFMNNLANRLHHRLGRIRLKNIASHIHA
ncbi:hypothetical protein ES703_119074 [subsurface metagenome]